MNKYRVPVKLIFTGTVDVIAEDDNLKDKPFDDRGDYYV